MRSHFLGFFSGQLKGARDERTPFLFAALLLFFSCATGTAFSATSPAGESNAARIEKARELVLKGERLAAVRIFKDMVHESTAPATSKNMREITQAWREVAEVYLTDKNQNQASLAESFWMARPKDAAELLLPVLKLEDSNLGVARLGARAALRAFDCAKAETFVAQAELVLPNGGDVKLLRLQVQDCLNGSNMSAPALKLPLPLAPSDTELTELEPALRLLAVKDAFRRKDLKAARALISNWESTGSLGAAEDPEFWFWKWRTSGEVSHDRAAARKYLRLCSDMTARRRKKFAMHPELCLHTESVESDLKSSEKSGS